MKKTILVASMMVCAVFLSNAQDATKVAVADPKNMAEFKFDDEKPDSLKSVEYNFGTIKQGDVVNHEFTFVNVGKEPLVITESHGSCGCTVPQWPKEPIKKGEKGTIKVTFNSAGKLGLQDKTVTITSNAKSNPKVIHIKGTVEKPADAPATPATTPAPVK
jgi:hypothetical protein